MREQIEWLTGPPLWRQAPPGSHLRRPAILRFADDAFMEQLDALLREEPAGLGGYVARNETWEEEHVGLQTANGQGPLKLYQPVHGRHYLVAAALCCRRYGYPDRRVDPAAAESATFVLRRLGRASADIDIDVANEKTYIEYAWSGGGWVQPGSHVLAPGEERLPLFAMRYPDGDRTRRLLAGTIPVGGRERFEAASDPTPPDLSGDPLADPVRGLLLERVIGALRQLQEGVGTAPIATAREVLAFALLDFAEMLDEHVSAVLGAEEPSEEPPGELSDAEAALQSHLDGAGFGPTLTWLEALRSIRDNRRAIEEGTAPDTGAGPVAGLTSDQIDEAIDHVGVAPSDDVECELHVLVVAALPDAESDAAGDDDPAPPPGPPQEDPAGDGSGALYWIRCVYERPECPDRERLVVSYPSEPFLLAAFFDPDAPYRPLAIPMPVDTSVAGLRRFPRNVSLLISRQLRRQMQRVEGTGFGDLDEGNLNDEGTFSWGMICSLSIPIITICALILLMIIVVVLNLVFWWLPFFKVCRPAAR